MHVNMSLKRELHRNLFPIKFCVADGPGRNSKQFSCHQVHVSHQCIAGKFFANGKFMICLILVQEVGNCLWQWKMTPGGWFNIIIINFFFIKCF